MKSLKKYKFLIISFVIFISSCINKSEKKDNKTEEQSQTTVIVSPQQQKAIGLEIGEISLRNLKTTLKANGKLMLPPQNQANVCLSVGGIVKKIFVTEGAYISQGQLLATIQNNDFIQLQQDFLQCKIMLTYLKTEFERQKLLQKENINSAKIYQKAETEYFTQITNYNALKQKLSLYNVNAENLTAENISNSFSVFAPIAGNINKIGIYIGSFAEPNKLLFDIVDNRYLHIDLTIFEKDISKIHEGQQIIFSDANHIDQIHTARIFSINKAFETGQQAVIAHAKIQDINETLLPGMFIEARITLSDSVTQAIPESAIVSNGNEHYIFIKQNQNKFKLIKIRLGASDLGFTEMFPFEKIELNQKIVIKGAYNLLSELTKGSSEQEE